MDNLAGASAGQGMSVFGSVGPEMVSGEEAARVLGKNVVNDCEGEMEGNVEDVCREEEDKDGEGETVRGAEDGAGGVAEKGRAMEISVLSVVEYVKQVRKIDASMGSLLVVDGVADYISEHCYPLRFECYSVLFCQRGRITGTIDGKELALGADDILFVTPGSIVTPGRVSQDTYAMAIMIQPMTLITSIFINKDVWYRYLLITRNPIVHLNPEDIDVAKGFFNLGNAITAHKPAQFDKQVSQHVMEAMIYELINIAGNGRPSRPSGPSGQSENLFLQFLGIASEAKGRCRNVAEIAGRLCVTPKHLSRVVSMVSGSSPMEWLHVITARQAANDLRYTYKSVKEIASELGFATLSSFGSFVRKYLGSSPRNFRRRG